MDDNRKLMGTVQDTFDRIIGEAAAREDLPAPPLTNLRAVASIVAAAADQIALGQGRLVPTSRSPEILDIRGRVVSQVGDNLSPSHPMPGALVRAVPMQKGGETRLVPPGAGLTVWTKADWYGNFELPSMWPTALSYRWSRELSLNAAVVRPDDGEVTWMLSFPQSGRSSPTGKASPYVVEWVPFKDYGRTLATAVVFRAAPCQVFPMTDPNTMKRYARFSLLDAKTMAEPDNYYITSSPLGEICFVPPETL
jgi:hypothetical protein